MNPKSYARTTLEHLKQEVMSSALVGNKVVTVYSPDDLKSKANPLTPPLVGVMYEGMRSVADQQKGLSTEMVFSLLVLSDKSLAGHAADPKPAAIDLLDSLRALLVAKRSPTNHFWKFVVEAPATEVGGNLLWVQRWSTAIPAMSRPS